MSKISAANPTFEQAHFTLQKRKNIRFAKFQLNRIEFEILSSTLKYLKYFDNIYIFHTRKTDLFNHGL